MAHHVCAVICESFKISSGNHRPFRDADSVPGLLKTAGRGGCGARGLPQPPVEMEVIICQCMKRCKSNDSPDFEKSIKLKAGAHVRVVETETIKNQL